MATVAEAPALPISIQPDLVRAIVDSVHNALAMCATPAHCVGLSAVPGREVGIVTGMIGLHGKVSGFITCNMSERFAICAVGGLLQESYGKLTSQVVDGVGEITNIICGGVKSAVAGGPWSFSHITVPSVIVGRGYQIAYARGLEFLCTTFEHQDEETVLLDDRLMHISMSLLKL